MNNKLLILLIGIVSAAQVYFSSDVCAKSRSFSSGEAQSITQTLDSMEKGTDGGGLRTHSSVIGVLEAKNMDIVEVLEVIAAKGNLNIVAGADVVGKVSIYLKNIDARDALKIILDTHKFVFHEEDDVIQVMSAQQFEFKYGYPFGQEMETQIVPILYADADEMKAILHQMKSSLGKVIYNEQTQIFVLIDSPLKLASMVDLMKKLDVPLETKIFELVFGDPADIAMKVEPLLTPDRGKMVINTDLNRIEVVDTPIKVKEIEKLVLSLDQQQKQVVYDVEIFQIILNEENDRGIDWEAIVSDFQSVDFISFQGEVKKGGSHPQLSFGTISQEDYPVLLDALDTVGAVHEVSRFLLDSMVDQKMEFDVRAKDLPSMAESKQENSFFKTSESVRFYLSSLSEQDDFAVSITPKFISLDRQSKIKVRSKNKALLKKEGEDQILVRLSLDDTVVIGGLFKEVTVASQRKMPFLGGLPLVGGAFRLQGERILKSEIIVFLIPRVIEK